MIKTLLLVPVRANDGRPFPPGAWRTLHERLRAFGGFSRLDNVRGEWVSEGRVFRDRSHQYTVSLDSWLDVPAWLEVVTWARELFGQEALYIEVAGVPEIIGPPRA
jgi:hypothetical protein